MSGDHDITDVKPSEQAAVEYMVHMRTYGDSDFVLQPGECGLLDHRIEGILIRATHGSDDLNLRYKAHLQGIGDVDWRSIDNFIGSRGERRRLEAIWIEPVGDTADKYDIYYSAYLQSQGWTGWMKNGEMCGTRGQKRAMFLFKMFIADKE